MSSFKERFPLENHRYFVFQNNFWCEYSNEDVKKYFYDFEPPYRTDILVIHPRSSPRSNVILSRIPTKGSYCRYRDILTTFEESVLTENKQGISECLAMFLSPYRFERMNRDQITNFTQFYRVHFPQTEMKDLIVDLNQSYSFILSLYLNSFKKAVPNREIIRNLHYSNYPKFKQDYFARKLNLSSKKDYEQAVIIYNYCIRDRYNFRDFIEFLTLMRKLIDL